MSCADRCLYCSAAITSSLWMEQQTAIHFSILKTALSTRGRMANTAFLSEILRKLASAALKRSLQLNPYQIYVLQGKHIHAVSAPNTEFLLAFRSLNKRGWDGSTKMGARSGHYLVAWHTLSIGACISCPGHVPEPWCDCSVTATAPCRSQHCSSLIVTGRARLGSTFKSAPGFEY